MPGVAVYASTEVMDTVPLAGITLAGELNVLAYPGNTTTTLATPPAPGRHRPLTEGPPLPVTGCMKRYLCRDPVVCRGSSAAIPL